VVLNGSGGAADDLMRPGWVSREAVVNGVRLRWVEAGPPDGPPVLLLHGFPECWVTWRGQMAALAAAGYRAVAPDLRGYGRSARPGGVLAYALPALVADALGLVRGPLGGRAAVVGHDWGGVIAWHLAAWHPGAVSRLAVVNAPHPGAYARELRRGPQALRSWYVALFALPWLPEALIRAGRFAALRRLFRTAPRRGALTELEIRARVAALEPPGALTAALNYYRALVAGAFAAGRGPGPVRVAAPTLVVWGERDAHLVPGLADDLGAWVPDLRVVRLPEASHWVMVDAPRALNAALLAFLAEARRG
jgi:pimeloyl-ACP methyl ester carboxylesterase